MGIVIAIIAVIIGVRELFNIANKAKIVRYFKETSVLVGGARGRGKDMLFNFVIEKRKRSYISNVQYAGASEAENGTEVKPKDQKWIDFEPIYQWSMGGNTNRDFIEGKLKQYKYPYQDRIDYYISDIGVYFPSQEFAYLNTRYKGAVAFQALARHLGDCNIHGNTQAFNRPWDKIREQFETFILMDRTRVLFGKFVKQRMYIYDRLESAEAKIKPMKHGIGRTARIEREKFRAQYGSIEKVTIRYILKNKYDSRRFKKMLEEAEPNEKEME